MRPDSTLSLRRLAAALAERLGRPVEAVSLLHSTRVPDEALGGVAARLLEPALAEFFSRHPEGEAVLLPLFFGASGALVEYVPERVAALKQRFPGARVRLAPALAGEGGEADARLAGMIADQVRASVAARGWVRPQVVLVDHGSPLRAVTAVRDRLARQLRDVLGNEVGGVTAASMERREGDAYAFNEPLLATALRTPPCDGAEVVVALQFLSPGRHAGPGGDIALICVEAEAERPGLVTQMTEPIAGDMRLVPLLAERLEQALAL